MLTRTRLWRKKPSGLHRRKRPHFQSEPHGRFHHSSEPAYQRRPGGPGVAAYQSRYIAISVMEGVALDLRLALQAFRNLGGFPAKEIRMVGGGSKSETCGGRSSWTGHQRCTDYSHQYRPGSRGARSSDTSGRWNRDLARFLHNRQYCTDHPGERARIGRTRRHTKIVSPTSLS